MSYYLSSIFIVIINNALRIKYLHRFLFVEVERNEKFIIHYPKFSRNNFIYC